MRGAPRVRFGFGHVEICIDPTQEACYFPKFGKLTAGVIQMVRRNTAFYILKTIRIVLR